jgi:hypothetical protein
MLDHEVYGFGTTNIDFSVSLLSKKAKLISNT